MGSRIAWLIMVQAWFPLLQVPRGQMEENLVGVGLVGDVFDGLVDCTRMQISKHDSNE